jgi:hypothetical protein
MRTLVKLLAILAVVLLTASFVPAANAGQAILSWTPPTTNSDGTPLTDLGGYKAYAGKTSGNYSIVKDVGNVTTYTVTTLTEGKWYFAVTAYDTSGNESGYSNEVSKTIAIPPTAPTGCTVQ